jgi:hypothetical protein
MAPEQLAGQAGQAADQFALAMCMVEAMNGARAPLGSTSADLAKKGKSVWGNGAPAEPVWDALARALRPQAADRFETMDAFIDAITSALTPAPASKKAEPLSRAVKPAPARANFAAWAAVAIALAAGAVATASALRQPRDGATQQAALQPGPVAPTGAAVSGDPTAATPTDPTAKPEAEAPSTPAPSGQPIDAPAPGPVAAPGAPAEKTDDSSPAPTFDPNDPLAGLKRSIAASDKVREATAALQARDGKKCLAKLDEAEAIDKNTGSNPLYRAQCEMLAGKCEAGARRIQASKIYGANTEQMVEQLRGMYCPASATATPKDRLKAIWLQASTGGSAEKCASYESQLKSTLASFGAEKPDSTAVMGAWSSVANCWVMTGSCSDGRRVAANFIAADRLDAYMENWIGQGKDKLCKK